MKKWFSLALALVMAVSLVTFQAPSASAANFTDSASITYKEAVDVITALQIMDGYSDGSFGPTSFLSRGAAAKIICNMSLGPTVANQMSSTATSFPDVPTNSAFAGYIAWCVANNIVSGRADGTFGPYERLSGNAFMKMLLGALGYDQEVEGYVGTNWSLNVQTKALSLGLTTGLEGTFAGQDGVTRQAACLFAFNTLQSNLVEYGSNTAAGRRLTQNVTSGANTARNIVAEDNSPYVVQFAEQKFQDLRKAETTDNFGRPATTWTLKNSEVGTYQAVASKTYYGDATIGTLYSDLGLTSPTSDVDLWVNGFQAYKAPTDGGSVQVQRGSDTKLSAVFANALGSGNAGVGAIGDGTQVQVYRGTNNKVTVCATNYFGGKIGSVNNATPQKDRSVVVTPATQGHGLSGRNAYPVGANGAAANFTYETNSFSEDDVVAYTYSFKDGKIQTMTKLNPTSGSLTRYMAGSNMVVNGTSYPYSYMTSFQGNLSSEGSLVSGNEYLVYLLSIGGSQLVLWVENAKGASANYALITAVSRDTIDGNRAKLLLTDGSEPIVNFLDVRNQSNITASDVNTIVSYTVNASGDYTLNRMQADEVTKSTNVRIQGRSISGLSATTNDDTVFVIKDANGYSVYTGNRNVGTNITGGVAYAYPSTSAAEVVFITDGRNSTISRELTFIAANSGSNLIKDSTSPNSGYRTFNAVVGGTISTIKVEVGTVLNGETAADSRRNGAGENLTMTVNGTDADKAPGNSVILNNTSINTDGFYTAESYYRSANIQVVTGTGITAPTSGRRLTIDGRDLYLASGVNIYLVDKDGKITSSSSLNSVIIHTYIQYIKHYWNYCTQVII